MSPEVRIFNPPSPNNPRNPKTWTYAQAEDRKEKAEWAARDLQDDDERGDEIEAMSVEEYAAERGVELVNPKPGGNMKRKVSTQEARYNPVAAALQTATRALDKQQDLYREIRKLEDELADRHAKLDAIAEIVDSDDPEFTADDRMQEIDEILGDEDNDSGGEESGARRVAHAGGR